MRGRDRTWRFWIFRSKMLSVKRRITTFLVSESLAVWVSRRVLEPRLLVSFFFRCSVEFGGVAGWSCEVKIRKLLWSDHCFNFRFHLTLLGWEICNHFEIWFWVSVFM
ncbi:hypothetical protein LINPERHAP2_LOCUS2592 [Linum perenne]